MARRSYSGSARATTLAGGITAAATSLTVADGTGYPDGSAGPFVVTVDAGLASEEKILCSSRTGNTLSVSSRGYDGTTAASHDNSAPVAHTISAVDLDEANSHVNAVGGGQHDITFTSTGLTPPASFPQGISTSGWNAGAGLGQPDSTSTFTVQTVKHSNLTMFQLAAGRDATPEGDEPLYFRVGYAGGTPEWGAWQRLTMTAA